MEPSNESYDLQRDTWAAALLAEYRQTGEQRLRDEVYETYAPLAKLTAARIAHPGQEHEDLIQEARLGLFEAMEAWDPERKVRFSTWAIAKMRYACIEYARQAIWGTRGMQTKLREAQRRLTAIENGAALTEAELLNGGPFMPAADQVSPLSLDSVRVIVSEESDTDVYLRDTITADINCEFAALQNLFYAEVNAGVDWLPQRERLAFRLYYHEDKTLKEVGKVLGVSESRVFQLHQQGMTRLRVRLKGALPFLTDAPYTATEDKENATRHRRRPRRGMAQIAA